MSKKDWQEVTATINTRAPNLLSDFINSGETFLPNPNMANPFDACHPAFTAKQLKKGTPGRWIPLYTPSSLPDSLRHPLISPVRCGTAAFFFYRGDIFFNLDEVIFSNVSPAEYEPVDNFIPLTLRSHFQRNENAYLNKPTALGILNHFLMDSDLQVFKKKVSNKTGSRLLYGQFGKIKLTGPISFTTRSGYKNLSAGFQFEIDLVLESREEIFIIEAKLGTRPQSYFSLLQLYYPLVYIQQLVKNEKKVRTIYFDVTSDDDTEKESYRLIEFIFDNGHFDNLSFTRAAVYHREES